MPLIERISKGQLLAVTVAAFATVFGLTYAIDDPRQAITVLYVVPIALTALAAGVRGGLVSAGIATVLVGVWIGSTDAEIGMSGWISRLIAFFMIAVLVGRYEQLARTVARRRAEEQAAAEVQEGVVQTLVIATYELRRGDRVAAQEAVDDALAAAKQIISTRLPEVRPGDLRRRRPDDEPSGS